MPCGIPYSTDADSERVVTPGRFHQFLEIGSPGVINQLKPSCTVFAVYKVYGAQGGYAARRITFVAEFKKRLKGALSDVCRLAHQVHHGGLINVPMSNWQGTVYAIRLGSAALSNRADERAYRRCETFGSIRAVTPLGLYPVGRSTKSQVRE